MPLYSLVPSFRPLLAPVPRLRFRTDTHTDRRSDRQTDTHTQDNYRNPPAHARRGLIMFGKHIICSGAHISRGNTYPVQSREPDVFCARTYIARAEKRGGEGGKYETRGGRKIRLVYLDRFFCALPECWQYQRDCSIG